MPALLRVTFCVIISFSRSKGTTVFCKLELRVEKKTLLKILLNPGLTLDVQGGGEGGGGVF